MKSDPLEKVISTLRELGCEVTAKLVKPHTWSDERLQYGIRYPGSIWRIHAKNPLRLLQRIGPRIKALKRLEKAEKKAAKETTQA